MVYRYLSSFSFFGIKLGTFAVFFAGMNTLSSNFI